MVQARSPQSTTPAQGNFRSLPQLAIAGQDAPKSLLEDILQIVVEESLHLPSMFTLVIQNDYFSGKGESPWRYKDLLQIGKTVKIGFSASTTDAKDFAQESEAGLIEGEITAIETHFSEKSQAPVIVRGYDTLHRLHRGQYNRSWQNVTVSDVVKKIAEEVGIPIKTLDNSGEPHDYLFQANQTNMQFLRDRASRIGFELFIQDGQLHFRKPKPGKELAMKWLKDVSSFRVRVTSAEQVKEVEVRAWDYGEKRAIVANKQKESVITDTQNGKGSDTSMKFNGKPPTPKRMVVDQPVFKPKEAEQIAQAVCDEIGGQFIGADASAEGNPLIRPGKVIKIEELGPHSGKYYVTETRHIYHERVYKTDFSVRGLRGGDLLTTLAPKSLLQPGQTHLVGIVTDNNDPKGWGRVKVKFPTLTEEHNSNWARIVSAGAGKGRGFDCLPEINDEVLVAFEHGDIHRPYVIGGVWNGKDQPPTPVGDSVQDGKVRLRTIKTRTGHQIQFVEEAKGSDSPAGIHIQTVGGHKLFISDTDKSICLSSTGNLKIEATGNIDISAGGIITVKGSLIKLN
jgi:phage protein D